MPITDRTLTEAAKLRTEVGTEADNATRTLADAWVKAWDDINRRWQTAATDLTAQQADLQRWPHPWELARTGSVQQALRATDQQLALLAQQVGSQVTTAADNAATATAEREPHILASQLPAALLAAALALYASRLTAHALDALTAQAGQRIAVLARPIGRATYDAVQREIVRGVPAGITVSGTTERLLGRVEAAFNTGLTRAITIARTETIDTARAAAAASHKANQDVVRGWIWACVCDLRSCIACYVMHGTEHATTDPGPLGHQQCRCSRLPFLRPWRDLGIGAAEPLGPELDGRARFDALPDADQLAILGPTRFELLRAGKVRWADLAILRDNPNWRPAYVPRPVADLQRLAAQPV